MYISVTGVHFNYSTLLCILVDVIFAIFETVSKELSSVRNEKPLNLFRIIIGPPFHIIALAHRVKCVIRCGREKRRACDWNSLSKGSITSAKESDGNSLNRVIWNVNLNNDSSAHQFHSRPKLKFFSLIHSFLLFHFYSFDKVILNEQKVQYFPNFEFKLAFSFHWACKQT